MFVILMVLIAAPCLALLGASQNRTGRARQDLEFTCGRMETGCFALNLTRMCCMQRRLTCQDGRKVYAPDWQSIHRLRTVREPLRLVRAKTGGRQRTYQQLDATHQNAEDEVYMQMALEEARKAFLAGDVPVGAVLVHQGDVVARAFNRVEAEGDPTAHAEMLCIQRAALVLGGWRLLDSTLYVTLEPCPMCAGALLQARVGQVVWGAKNTLLGADGSWISLFPKKNESVHCKDRADTSNGEGPIHPFHPDVIVRRGVLAPRCSQMMKSFFQMRRKSGRKSVRRSGISRHPLIRLLLVWAGQAIKAFHRKLSRK